MKLHNIILDDLKKIVNENINWEKLANSRVMITGVNGMIASYIVYTLLYLNDTKNLGIRILGVARNEEKLQKRFRELLDREDFEYCIQDITEPIKYNKKVDYIIHAASQTGPAQFVQDPVGTIAANTIGTMNLLKCAVENSSRGFLFLSTREIYGQQLGEQEFIGEEDYGILDPTLVRSCYPESKRMSETLCASFRQQYGLKTKIIRIAHTYGPGQLIGDGRVVGDFLKNVINEQDIVMNSDGSAILGLTYISDVITGLFLVLLNFPELVYNLSSDKGVLTVKELAQLLTGLNKNKAIKTVFQEASKEVQAGYLKQKIALLSSRKAYNAGWNPNVGLEEGFKRTIAYFGEIY